MHSCISRDACGIRALFVLAVFVALRTAAAESAQAHPLTSLVRANAPSEIVVEPTSDVGRAFTNAIEQGMADKRLRASDTGTTRKLEHGVRDLRTRVIAEKNVRLAAADPSRSTGTLELANLSVPQLAKVANDGAMHVYVHISGDPQAAEAALKAAGLTVELVVPQIRVVQGWIAADHVDAIAALDVVTKVALPDYARSRTGSKTSEGDALLKANLVRQMPAPGPYTGVGVKVGIISDGATNLASAVASGDLPNNITVHPTFRRSGNEATAMCEIVNDLAPGAQLYVAGPSTSAEMITAIQWMIDQGCQVICDDLGFYSQPFFEDGTIANAARNAVVSSGRVYVSAAGNDAQDHYQGLYVDGGSGLHDYKLGAGVDTGLDITVVAGGTVTVVLQWNDPFSGASNDYDLYLGDPSNGAIVARSEGDQTGTQSPIEVVSWTNTGATSKSLQILVKRFNGVAKTLELFVLGGGFVADDDEVAADSIFGHPAVAEVISAGTINASDSGLSTAASYSSRGPSTIAFPSAETRQTPFITGIDGVQVTGAGGFPNPFYGTSASAPHIAAICALMLERNPFMTPVQIRAALSSTAIDKGSGGFDNVFGYGLPDALAAVNQLLVPFASQPQNQTAIRGNAATFSFSINASITLVYQWQRRAAGTSDFLNLPTDAQTADYFGSTSQSLTVRSAQTAMDGDEFRCVVSNFGANTMVTAVVKLTVLTPATFTTPPANADAAPAATMTFTAAVTGTVPMSYQWKKNGLIIPGATSTSLTLAGVGAADAGSYSIAVTNVAGTTISPSAALTVSSDAFGGRLLIPSAGVTTFATNTSATAEPGEPAHGGKSGGKSIWWTWTAPWTGHVVVDTIGSAIDTVLAIYTGTAVGALAPVASDDNSAGVAATSKLTFMAVAGTTYQIAVDGVSGANGKVTLHVEYAYNFSTAAGGASRGSTDGDRFVARFNDPEGIAVDNAGNTFVADRQNQIIRKITSAGVVSTFAGMLGQIGFADGSGSAARFSFPQGVVVDSAGNLFVADTGNNVIRRITPAGVVTTWAGSVPSLGSVDGVGTAAGFAGPRGLVIDASGNVYVADTGAHTIRKITPAGVVTTIAGAAGSPGSTDGIGPAARFRSPYGIAVDSAGVLYVTDTENYTIRRIGTSGVVTTLAGLAGSQGSTDGTGDAARFVFVRGLMVDGAGVIYVADATAIRKITPTGVVSLLAGSYTSWGSINGTGSEARFTGPGAMAVNPSGGLLIVDTVNNVVRAMTGGNVVTTYAGLPGHASWDGPREDARFLMPMAVAVDADGNAYVADRDACTIRKISAAGQVTTLAGLPGVTGSTDGTGSSARFTAPQGIAVSGNGTILVADVRTLRKVTSAGVVTTLAGSANTSGTIDGTGTGAAFVGLVAVAVDDAGNAFVLDNAVSVRKVTPAGVVTTIGGSIQGHGAIAVDRDGNVYILGGTLTKFTPSGTKTEIANYFFGGNSDGPLSSATFSIVNGMAIDRDGNFFVAQGNGIIRKLTNSGIVTTIGGVLGFSGGYADGTGSEAQFSGPAGLACDSAGNLFIADRFNGVIRKAVYSRLPNITQQPVAQNATSGTNLSLAVSATDNGPLTYQWRKDGTPIYGATNATLALSPIKATDAGTYDVVVSTEGGSLSSSLAAVTVSSPPPAINTHPLGRSVGVGGTMTFAVSATSSAPLTYQWRKGGIDVTGATNNSYTIPTISANDAANYEVVVSNDGGSVPSNSATLTVLPNPLGYSARVMVTTAGVTGYFALEGSETKHLLLRAVGPTLGTLGTTGFVADPQIVLLDAVGTTIATNDNWGTIVGADLPAIFNQVGATPFANGSTDAALYTTLAPGAYQVRVSGVGGATGIALIELFDTDTNSRGRIAYVGIRAPTSATAGGINQGISMTSAANKRLLVRAVGPALNEAGALLDPQVQFIAGSTVMGSNDNWGNTAALITAAGQAGAFALPAGSADAAVLIDTRLDAAVYTAQVPGGSASGDVLLEIYDLNASGVPAFAPIVVGAPQSTTVSAGNSVVFRALAAGAGGASYQWRKDTTDISGATGTELVFNAQTTDAGSYDVRITTALGTATSSAATLTVTPAVLAGTHAVVGPGYFAGGSVTISDRLTYPATTSNVSLNVTLPAGWSYVSSSGSAANVQPGAGATGTIVWTWTTLPPLPITFSYVLNAPATSSGAQNLASSLTAQLADGSTQTAALTPGPLPVQQVTTHSADTDRDFAISLFELTRVIELYNTRNGTARTGAYQIQEGSEDGFAANAARSSGSTAALARFHSADTRGATTGTPRDGAIDLFELTRVIELYNTRSGTTRTGAYHVQANSEDGFAPGP